MYILQLYKCWICRCCCYTRNGRHSGNLLVREVNFEWWFRIFRRLGGYFPPVSSTAWQPSRTRGQTLRRSAPRRGRILGSRLGGWISCVGLRLVCKWRPEWGTGQRVKVMLPGEMTAQLCRTHALVDHSALQRRLCFVNWFGGPSSFKNYDHFSDRLKDFGLLPNFGNSYVSLTYSHSVFLLFLILPPRGAS